MPNILALGLVSFFEGIDVVHVRTGAFETDLHSIPEGAKTLATYSEPFSRFSQSFEDHLTKAFAVVDHQDPRLWAEQLDNIIHATTADDEYWVGVSWQEVFAAKLPQSVFDMMISERFKMSKL
jgi:hypothetical protein